MARSPADAMSEFYFDKEVSRGGGGGRQAQLRTLERVKFWAVTSLVRGIA
jgi:hypothetical protein